MRMLERGRKCQNREQKKLTLQLLTRAHKSFSNIDYQLAFLTFDKDIAIISVSFCVFIIIRLKDLILLKH